jgi:hypothetical protein
VSSTAQEISYFSTNRVELSIARKHKWGFFVHSIGTWWMWSGFFAFVLVFIGVKMLFAYWLNFPIIVALGVVVAILVTTVVLSILIPSKDER